MSININLIEPQLKKDEVIIESTENIIEESESKVDNISIREGVWIDGIRIDGFNTHLYECIDNKFITKNSTKGLLIIDDGTQIDIWLDEIAYNSIKNNDNCLKIDTFVNGKLEESNYPIRFNSENSLIDAVNPNIDLDAIVRLTFKENKWHYSGGLCTSTTINGDITVDPIIENEIKVTGVNIGSYKNGESITPGTPVEEILRNILTNKIGVKISYPKLTMSLTNPSPFEVGEPVGGEIEVSYQDGQFIGETGYEYYTLNAGCTEPDNYIYTLKGEILKNNNYSIPSISEGITTFTVYGTHGQSTEIPEDNTGEKLNDIKIDSATISTKKDINAYYKAYSVIIPNNEISADNISELMTDSNGYFITSDTVKNKDIYKIQGGESMFLFLPQSKTFTIKNSLGSPAQTEFVKYAEVTNQWKTVYNVYQKRNDSTSAAEYKELTFAKAQ